MDNRQPAELEQIIHLNNGYRSKPIWMQKENISTYYDYQTDSQCGVPIKSLKELKKELGLDL